MWGKECRVPILLLSQILSLKQIIKNTDEKHMVAMKQDTMLQKLHTKVTKTSTKFIQYLQMKNLGKYKGTSRIRYVVLHGN